MNYKILSVRLDPYVWHQVSHSALAEMNQALIRHLFDNPTFGTDQLSSLQKELFQRLSIGKPICHPYVTDPTIKQDDFSLVSVRFEDGNPVDCSHLNVGKSFFYTQEQFATKMRSRIRHCFNKVPGMTDEAIDSVSALFYQNCVAKQLNESTVKMMIPQLLDYILSQFAEGALENPHVRQLYSEAYLSALNELNRQSSSQDAAGMSMDKTILVSADGTGGKGPESRLVSDALVRPVLSSCTASAIHNKDEFKQRFMEGLAAAGKELSERVPALHIEISSTITVVWLDLEHQKGHIIQVGDCSVGVYSADSEWVSESTCLDEPVGAEGWQDTATCVSVEMLKKVSDLKDKGAKEFPSLKSLVELDVGPVKGDGFVQEFDIPSNGKIVAGSDGFFDNRSSRLNQAQQFCKEALRLIAFSYHYIDPRAISNTILDLHECNPAGPYATTLQELDRFEGALETLKQMSSIPLGDADDRAKRSKTELQISVNDQVYDERQLKAQIEALKVDLEKLYPPIQALEELHEPMYQSLHRIYHGLTTAEITPSQFKDDLSLLIDHYGRSTDWLKKNKSPITTRQGFDEYTTYTVTKLKELKTLLSY